MGDHVFICYSRKDSDFAVKLATNLKNRGVAIWLDQWDIPLGANWNREIEKALKKSTRLLLVLSPSSVNSDEVQCEWLSALDEKRVVVPILYRQCDIPMRLKPIQYIDFTSRSPDDKTGLDQILNALKKTEINFIKDPDRVVDLNFKKPNIIPIPPIVIVDPQTKGGSVKRAILFLGLIMGLLWTLDEIWAFSETSPAVWFAVYIVLCIIMYIILKKTIWKS
jgi:hypothetical protein